jgi:hypothetical protein
MKGSSMLLFCAIIFSAACSKTDSVSVNCGTHNGSQLYLGPQGGCYYINSNGNKTYVDRSECKC